MPRNLGDIFVDGVIELERLSRFTKSFSYRMKRFFPRLSELVTSTKRHLKIVAVHEYVEIFQEDSLLESLRTILKKSVPVFFVFHLSDDFSKALGKLKNEYPVLCSLFDEYENFRIYWCRTILRKSYCLSDAGDLCVVGQSLILRRKRVVFYLSAERIPDEELPRVFQIDTVRDSFSRIDEAFDSLISSGKCQEIKKEERA